MKQNYSMWKDEEVKKLFAFMEDGKKRNIPLSVLFKNYAKAFERMPNSVRNYYYAELSNLQTNPERVKLLDIDLSIHKKCEQVPFDKAETKKMISEILRLIAVGYSVRKACLKLANGDISTMVRYQNKFRTVESKQQELIKECKKELADKGFNMDTPKTNVIRMQPKQIKLADNEITSLFLGLVKLVKKQAMDEANITLKKEAEFANDTLRKTLVELAGKNLELKELRKQFKVISSEKLKLSEEIEYLRCNKVDKLINKFGKVVESSKKNTAN